MQIRKRIVHCASALLALSLMMLGGTTSAQERDEKDKDREHTRFEDHDRRNALESYKDNHDHLPDGLRDRDRLAPELETRLRLGEALDRDLRHRIHPAPHDLLDRLPPCPKHYRYVLIGGHVCLIDDSFHLTDIIHFELNL